MSGGFRVNSGSCFPEDHYIPELRGKKRSPPSNVRRAIARRMAYLEEQILIRRQAGKHTQEYVYELIALAQIMEEYEAAHPTEGATTRQRVVGKHEDCDPDSIGNK